MAIKAKHKEVIFGVGDLIKVYFHFYDGKKKRKQIFEGIVIKIKGRGKGKTFTIRKIGINQIGIERIFPLYMPTIDKINILKKGYSGVKRSKLYYLRDKSKKEIEKIYSRSKKKKKNNI